MAQPPLAIVRAWQEKSAEVSVRSKDRLFAVLTKGFDAMATLLAKDSDPADVQQVLAHLNVDRAIALQFDKAKDDSLRDLVYGLLESLHVSLNEWNEERNQRKDTGEISTQTEEFNLSFLGPIIPSYEASLPTDNHSSNDLSHLSNPSPAIPIGPKEEPIDIHNSLPQDYEIYASEIMRDEKMIMKEEMDNQYSDPTSSVSLDGISTAADFTRSLLPFNPREEPTVPQDNQMQSLLFPPLSIIPPHEAVPIDFVHPSENLSTMEDFTSSNPKLKTEDSMETQDNDNEVESMEEDQNDSEMQPSDFMDNPMNFGDEIFDDRDLVLANPSNEVSMSTNDMDESREPQICKDGRDSLENDLIDNEGEEEEAIERPIDTPKDTNSVKAERKRSSRRASRPMQYAESMDDSDDNGGPSMKKSRSDSTGKDVNKRKSIKGEEKSGSSCNILNVSKENATELECPECEFRTRIVGTWTNHLRIKHATTPDLCNRGNVTVIKGEEKSKHLCKKLNVSKENARELECPECEFSTRIVHTWICHLSNKHSTTPSLAGLALLCECGHESLSATHSRNCNRGNTTVIRKRDGPIRRLDDEKTTPQCVLCEVYPRTACGYTTHLHVHHKSSLVQNGIYLKCSCGREVRSNHSHTHLDECNPRQFTLHKLDDE